MMDVSLKRFQDITDGVWKGFFYQQRVYGFQTESIGRSIGFQLAVLQAMKWDHLTSGMDDSL